MEASLQSELAAEKLRSDIISGALSPGIQLRMRELLPRYAVGVSPMREALVRLAAEGFLEQKPNRGVRVPLITVDELEDLSRTREIIESEAIALATVHGDAAWEDEVSASFHLYERALRETAAGGSADWIATEPRHHRCHRALVAACPYPTLRTMCDVIHQRLTRYRFKLNLYGFNVEDVLAEHRLLVDAALTRDPKRAMAAARAHFGLTATALMNKIVPVKGSNPKH